MAKLRDLSERMTVDSVSGQRLISAKRVVIKIGSALLVDATGSLNRSWLSSMASEIAGMRAQGQEVILVSSGAIALGRRALFLQRGKLRLEESQAAAAVGQISLAHAYKELLDAHGIQVAQILLTLGDTEQRRRFLNARGTINTLLSLGSVPVINENDTVATAEIRYGDNDRLAARVSQMIGADVLVLLSDVDGLYEADPRVDPRAQRVPEVHAIDAQIESMAGRSMSHVGSGGMPTKIAAAKICMSAGCSMCIALGTRPSPLSAVAAGARCTWFVAPASPLAMRKQWIAGSLEPGGALWIDSGAVAALVSGKSLLPAGVVRVAGRFDRGDTVSVLAPDSREVARGLCAYADADAARIAGRKSAEIEAALGYRGRDEMIHRDDLVIVARV